MGAPCDHQKERVRKESGSRASENRRRMHVVKRVASNMELDLEVWTGAVIFFLPKYYKCYNETKEEHWRRLRHSKISLPKEFVVDHKQ